MRAFLIALVFLIVYFMAWVVLMTGFSIYFLVEAFHIVYGG